MLLKKAIIEYFKGITHFEADFHESVNIVFGKNGTGKSTLGIACTYPFTGKDLEMQNEPYIRNLNMENSEPSTTTIWDVNGKEVKIRKFQVDIRTKKQIEENAPVRISNRYEINDVPKSQKDFFKDLAAMGFDVDNFLLLTNPDYLMSLKVDDRRKVIFGLSSGVTDLDVASAIPECEGVKAELEKGYTVEEITAREKTKRKKADEKIKALPSEIIGMEKSKVSVDPTLPGRMDALKDEIDALTKKMDDAKAKGDVSNINGRIRELASRKTEIYNDVNSDRIAKYSEARAKTDDAYNEYTKAKAAIDDINSSGKNINEMYQNAMSLKNRLSIEIENIKTEKFTARKKCPTCGQDIPKADIDRAKANWKKQQSNRLKEANDRLRAVNTQAENYKKEGKALAEKKAKAEEALKVKSDELARAKNEMSKYSEQITPDYTEIDAEIAKLNAEKAKANEYIKEAYALEEQISEKRNLLGNYIKAQAAEVNNSFIDERIEEAKASQKHYAQAKADAEHMLYQLQLISQKKNEMLSDQVNSHFTRVKFRLFTTQKNGEIKDDCTPLVLCSDGEYRDMTYSANTAAIVAAKLDICAGLQKFYGQNLPIWLDGAECFDEKNRAELKMDNQLILLCVSEDERLVVK